MLRQNCNWLSSPQTIELLLSLIGHGHRTNIYAQSNKQLKEIKGYEAKSKIFLSPEHKLETSPHDVDIEKIDFKKAEAKKNIGKWVEKNGFKNWENVKNVSDTTKCVLLNISSLKMPWYESGGCGPLMKVYNTFSYTEDVKYVARILELPLQNRDLKVVILIPNELDVLYGLFNKLVNEGFNAAINSIQPLFTAVSELNAPKIKFQATNQLNLEKKSKNILSVTQISIGDVNINNTGALISCLTCILLEKLNQPSAKLNDVRDSSTYKPFLFTVNYKNNPIFVGQHVSE